MKQIDIKEIIYEKNPAFLNNTPQAFKEIVFKTLNRLLYLNRINRIIEQNSDKKNFEFIDEVFEELDISYSVSSKDRNRIPAEGKLICIANHPLGGLDGMILLKLLSEIRSDVKIVVNDILLNIDNLSSLFLPLDITKNKLSKENICTIDKALQNEEAVIIFPSGEVSRLNFRGISDSKWHQGVIHFARKHNSPVLPVFIHARNSFRFYFISMINKKLSTFLLPSELFNKAGKTVRLKIGNHIPAEIFSNRIHRTEFQLKLVRKHLSRIQFGKPGIFKTEKNIVKPVERKLIRKQLSQSKLIGETRDGKQIFFIDYDGAEEVSREIARLREVTFRKVGEGTGDKLDIDKYDKIYKHLVLWDDDELEIIGSYRIGVGNSILKNHGLNGFYTSTLFHFNDEFISLLPQSIELGRSFIQSKFWNTNALDYLWQGIGTFLWLNPDIRYLFGGVSFSSSYPDDLKSLIIYYFNKWYGTRRNFVQSKNKYTLSGKREEELELIFGQLDYQTGMQVLKRTLKLYGHSIPVLFKQYAELCDIGGTSFLDFGVDKDFNNCIDGFILVDVQKMKADKKQRYIYKNGFEKSFHSRND